MEKNSAQVYQAYNVGDVVTYNGMNFYVIENSDESKDSVTLLKAEPLTVDEVNTYGVGHINRYTVSSVGTASNKNGYGGMAYYTSQSCGIVNGSFVDTGCTTDYAQSEVKYAVDAWAADKLKVSDLKEDSLGYKTRLLTVEDLINNLGYEFQKINTESGWYKTENTPSWVYNENYFYWTMSAYEDGASSVWSVNHYDRLSTAYVYNYDHDVVRPVITLLKSAI